MDLVKGNCFFCSNKKVVSDSRNVQNTIITLFTGSDINEEKLLTLRPPRVCHLCYHSFVLMKRTHDDILHSSSAEKVHENCHLCGNSEDVIKVLKWNHFETIGKDYRGIVGNSISNACSDCLYYLETKNSVKDKLIAAIPQLKQQLSDFASNITSHSTPLKRTRTKAERKVPVEFVDLTQTNTDINGFEPLRNDPQLRKLKLVSEDLKLMNQILIVRLQRLETSLNNVNETIEKKNPQKRVRFKDIHELEEDICSMPKKINYKETRYHDNLTFNPYTDKNSEKEDELVEYEIKTTPRRSRYRDYSDDNSSDSLDSRKKSNFKIKLTKKKPNAFPLKPALVKPPLKSALVSKLPPMKPVVKTTPKPALRSRVIKSAKRRPVARSRRHSVVTPNIESIMSPKTRSAKSNFTNNLVINVERMKIPELNGIEEEEEIEVNIEGEDLIESEDPLDPLRIDNFDNEDVIEEKNCFNLITNDDETVIGRAQEVIPENILNTNGHIEEEEEDTDCEITNTKEIISISSEDVSQTEYYTEDTENVEETVDEIKMFIMRNTKETSEIDKLRETQLVKEFYKINDPLENNEEMENSNKQDEIIMETNTSQIETTVKDVAVEQIEEDFNGSLENESQEEETDKVVNSQDEAETENSQEDKTDNSQEEDRTTENSQEEDGTKENSQEEDRTTENSQEVSSQESRVETSQEDKTLSQEESKDEDDNSMENWNLDIDNIDAEKVIDSCEIEDNGVIKKRKREEDSLSDSGCSDKKKKKVTFSVDLHGD
ncbi:glutamic acid-rich protein-like [Diorhabda sublineata]|uniref:glutamic acid-rich protein-like n=1 Tax=Diorhabda sublineata TaxID=1163346 RepID=UPI0024E05FC3|nr:glutamic acid-rich protein-like [Diorhabda sublineata]